MPTIENPRGQLTDSISKGLKVWVKGDVVPFFGRFLKSIPFFGRFFGEPSLLYQTIIPATPNHHRLVLGAQPRESDLEELSKNVATAGGHPEQRAEVHVISMLTEPESLIEGARGIPSDTEPPVTLNYHRKRWLDHGTIDVTNAVEGQPVRNQTITSMEDFQRKDIYDDFFIPDPPTRIPTDRVFYCHCMAGKSRSFLETMSLIYFSPDKNKLFDFGNWPHKDVQALEARGLDWRLLDHPSFSEIAEFVSMQRPEVKKLTKMDGDQAGLIGLMSLRGWAQSLKSDPNSIKNRDPARRLVDAQNIGLMLKAPLDQGFRDPNDRKEQKQNLVNVFKAYEQEGINLLMAMVIPLNEQIDPTNYIAQFEERFRKLQPSEQARFAILLKDLEQHEHKVAIKPLKNSSFYANIAAKNAGKLTAGDQTELLRTFGSIVDLDYEDAIKKIVKGSKVDKFNAGTQLAELLNIAHANNAGIPEDAIKAIRDNKLSYAEQLAFVKRLQQTNSPTTAIFLPMVEHNFNKKRWFFSNSPTQEQRAQLEETQRQMLQKKHGEKYKIVMESLLMKEKKELKHVERPLEPSKPTEEHPISPPPHRRPHWQTIPLPQDTKKGIQDDTGIPRSKM